MSATAAAVDNRTLVNYGLVRANLVASVGYLVIAILAGMTYSLQFVHLYPFENIAFLAPGRMRVVHTQAVAYAWIASAFMAILYYVIPKLTGKRVLSDRLGWITFFGWTGICLATVFGVLGGHAQGVEWGETPVWLDPIIVVFFAMFAINIIAPIAQSKEKAFFVTVWYVVAALVWTALNYIMGNFLPQYFVPGTGGAAIVSMFIHDLVGLFVTPIGIGIIYYLLPILLGKPIYSHALSLIGFWGLAFFYPLNSTHHFIYSPIPMWAQYAGIIASVGVHVVVYSVVYNLFMTMRGEGHQLARNVPLQFILVGGVCYLLTCIQCAVQVTLTFQRIIHFTDWVVGHAHLVLFGTFSFWLFAWIYYLWPRIFGRELYSQRMANWHFWLSTIGLFLMWIDLGLGGVMQGMMWRELVPFIDTVIAMEPIWMTRALSGLMILVGQFIFVVNLYLTARAGEERREVVSRPALGAASA